VREAHLLARRGVRVVAVLLDALSFTPTGSRVGIREVGQTRALLETGGVLVYTIRQDDNISAVLSTPVGMAARARWEG
jgi:hypothetical protein